MYHLPQDWLT
ncbi:hypothetical protein ECEC1865_3479, partial [Escherichia coli EC1865]